MTVARYRLIDRLPVPALAALSRTWPDVLAAIARDTPADGGVPCWERPAEVERIMRVRPGLVRGERVA